MEEFSASIRISVPRDQVWKVVSDVDCDPQYWDSIGRIRNVSRESGVVVRDVYLGGDNRCRQKITLFPNEGIHLKWVKGPIIGIRDIILSDCGDTTILEVQTRYRLEGILALFSRGAAKYLREESEGALKAIKAKAEGVSSEPVLEERRLWADLIHAKM